jgi:hypothetical protein
MKKEKVGAIVLAVSAGLFLLATSVALVLPRLRRRVQKSELKNILFIGDSQTKPTWSYANKLASKLGVSFQKIAENGKHPTMLFLFLVAVTIFQRVRWKEQSKTLMPFTIMSKARERFWLQFHRLQKHFQQSTMRCKKPKI